MRDSPDTSLVLLGPGRALRHWHLRVTHCTCSHRANQAEAAQVPVWLFLTSLESDAFPKGLGWGQEPPVICTFLTCILQCTHLPEIKISCDDSITGQRWSLSLCYCFHNVDVDFSFSFLPILVTLLCFRPQTTFCPCLLRSSMRCLG